MTTTAVVEQKVQLPAHLAVFSEIGGGSDLTSGLGAGFPVLSLKGKVWAVVRGGEREIIKNDDGDPRASIEVVIIKANPALSKVYYAKGYEEGAVEKPDCYSNDGVAPEADAQAPQSAKCQTCPHNVWGSKIGDNGVKYKACTDSRRIVVAPVGQLNDPMLLRIPAASLRPLSDYGDAFEKKGVPYQAAITKMGFDAEAASPKVTFKFVGFINAEQAAAVKETLESDIVNQIAGLVVNHVTPEQLENLQKAETKPAPAKAETKPAPAKAETKPAKAPKAEAPKPEAPKAGAAPASAPAPTRPVETDDLESALAAALGE